MIDAYYQVLGVSSFLGFMGCFLVLYLAIKIFTNVLKSYRFAFFFFVSNTCAFHFYAAIEILGMGYFEALATSVLALACFSLALVLFDLVCGSILWLSAAVYLTNKKG